LPPPAPASPEDIPKWNLWPDGIFQLDFSWEEVSRTKRLLTHWVERTSGGDRRGAEDAEVWDKGKRLTRTCLGVLVCDNQDCQRITRPMTNPSQFKKQLTSACRCGAEFKHQTCGVRSILWSWSGGIRYQHDGFHYHSRPPAIHSTTDEQKQFTALVQQNPKSGPLQLIVGVPTVEGPGKSVADISDIYINADRVAKEWQKIRRGTNGFGTGDLFIATFADFDMKHPGFLVSEVFGSITVISFQTPFMLSRLVHEYIDDDAVNGLVNDAAHGWWKEANLLLMITSVYSPDLNCWVPGLLSYTNGATTNHFSHHFRALFEGIAVEAERRGIEVEDRLFVGVSFCFSTSLSSFKVLIIDRLWISVKPSGTDSSKASSHSGYNTIPISAQKKSFTLLLRSFSVVAKKISAQE